MRCMHALVIPQPKQSSPVINLRIQMVYPPLLKIVLGNNNSIKGKVTKMEILVTKYNFEFELKKCLVIFAIFWT